MYPETYTNQYRFQKIYQAHKIGIYHLCDVPIQVEPVLSHQAISAQQTYGIETTSNQRRCDVRSHRCWYQGRIQDL